MLGREPQLVQYLPLSTLPSELDIDGNHLYVSGTRGFYIFELNDYLCGDANGDESMNMGDAGFIINYIFYDGVAPEPLGSGDANADGSCNLADAGYIINYIFYDGPEPICP